VGAHDKTMAAMAKTAAGMPFPPPKPNMPIIGGGQNAPGVTTKRDIPKDHPYDPRSLKPMAKMLWAMSVSLGHALTAYRQFTRLKSVTISPDGMLGGRGYVMPIKDVRAKLYEACEALSLISDTVHDEINGPHWKPRLAQLDGNDVEDIERFIQESQKLLDNPEDEPEEEMKAIEGENDAKWSGKKPKTEEAKKEEPSSGIPGAPSTTEESHAIPKQKQASALHREFTLADLTLPEDALAKRVLYRKFYGNSTIPVETLSGPRVDHLGPGEGTGPFNSYNRNEPDVDDEWGRNEGVGDAINYPSEWEGDTSGRRAQHYRELCSVCSSVISQCRCMSQDKVTRYGLCEDCSKDAASSVPDSNSEPTKTEGYDFGIGYGEGNDAHGQGAGGYGAKNPETGDYGVAGPSSGLPKDPGGAMHDHENSGTTEGINVPSRAMWAADFAELPQDDLTPVARSDYYQGPKGNTVSQSEVPGDESATFDGDRDLPNIGEKFEHLDNPYIKFDYTTKNYRPDTTYQRRPREGSRNG